MGNHQSFHLTAVLVDVLDSRLHRLYSAVYRSLHVGHQALPVFNGPHFQMTAFTCTAAAAVAAVSSESMHWENPLRTWYHTWYILL